MCELSGAAEADDNVQTIGQPEPGLPFRYASFALVPNGHESFVAKEVAPVLHRRIHDEGALVFTMPGFFLVVRKRAQQP